MIRSLHRWFGLIAAVLVTVIALSGTALSVFPASEALINPAAQQISVAELAARVQAAEPSVEQIRRTPSGRITAYYFEGDQPASSIIDPATGTPVGNADTSALQRWLTNLHRSLFLDDAGRLVVAGGAAAMLTLTLSGLFLLARRAGGWRYILKPAKGTGNGQLHAIISRLALPGLLLSSLTALWMTAATFGYLPEGAGAPPFPSEVSGATGIPVASITVLQETPVDTFRSLSFPAAGDATDAFTLKTDAGEGYIDQGNGGLLAWNEANWVDRLTGFLTMLHTGQGMAWLGLLLGLSALAVPVLGWTGLAVWLKGRGKRKRVSVSASEADTIVLVGSEGGTTWGFAETLRSTLSGQGIHVHVGPMSTFNPEQWAKAKRLILLTATYGDGEAPVSARGFLERFRHTPVRQGLSLAILGFGDRSFPAYCGFAADITQAAEGKGWEMLLPFDTVDRQSPQDFSRWGRGLAEALGLAFELNHQPAKLKTCEFSLLSRRDYGASVQATTAILRFALPKASLWQRVTGKASPWFEAGDLVGVVPEGSEVPRFYSLASSTKDGFLEICVRKQPGGLCSGQLTALEPGQTVTAFVRPNLSFRPARGRKPVILIGAGTGIGPLAGFARANQAHRPMYLYFGTRHPASDALYAEELSDWKEDGRLAGISTAFSRSANPAYVQDILRKDAARIGKLIAAGGQVLVCGGRDMAAGVAAALSEILMPQGVSLATLKAEGRYAEDVY
ncbi:MULTISPECIES: PepSY domain-containing protein [Alphaproteobacteria]|uniref:NADPH--hemoprotein reductase n=2 Tax=Alphaproteobacteria TaxID=28211 RepID=A0A512HNR8_9HYPH|nr:MULTISPECIES: PepSY domain-containing protein [Alphaproteobacteria]GEO87030.1 NADPH flavoprotein [Ciceribacter naphthalenivorans]GLR21594.1 NADPH flavoprotein [Ciceribacter naphthalenivorans]GLT04450.1 NADPH flavoprotein [Sphingomonas psychrolutea]